MGKVLLIVSPKVVEALLMDAASNNINGFDAFPLGQDYKHAAQHRGGSSVQQPAPFGHPCCPDQAQSCQGVHLRSKSTTK